MTLLDWVLLGVFGYFFIRGLFRGFLLELFDLLALTGGYFAARLLGPALARLIVGQIPLSRWLAGIIAAVILFITAAILIRQLARLLRRVARAAAMGGLDRIAGALIGFIKGVLISIVLMLLISLSPLSHTFGEYAARGRVSSVFWLTARMLHDALRFEPLEPSMALASWLRSAGLNEEAVLIITEQPEMMDAVLATAKSEEINLPVKRIHRGEPDLPMPLKVPLPPALQTRLVEILEDTTLSLGARAQMFWELIDHRAREEGIDI